MKKILQFTLLSLVMTLGFSTEAWGQENISVGTNYSQNFDGIGTLASANLPQGWRIQNVSTVRTLASSFSTFDTATSVATTFSSAMSSSAANGRYNFGGTTATDRSIGGLSSSSASKTVSMALELKNNGVEEITSFSISYDVERYRNGSNAAGFSIRFYYSLTGLADSWVEIPELVVSFTSNANNNGSTSNPMEVKSVSNFMFNQVLSSNENIYFAWSYSVTSGTTTSNAQALGIDNVSITAFNSVPSQTTIWDGSTWSNGEPTITKNAIIQGDYTTTSDLEALSLTVDSGIFTIASGTTVTVEGAVVNNAAAANFVVANNGNLVQNNDDANVGAITVHSNSQPLMRLDYTLWSSPVAGQNLKAFSPNTLTSRFYVYDETAVDGNTTTNNGTYVTILNGTNEAAYAFEAAQGYLIRTPNNHPTTPTVYNGVFTGVPQNGDFSATLSNVNAGYNLVGNPYPSSIDLNAFFTGNSAIENTVWFWRKTNGAAGDGYVTANNLGYTFPGQSADGATNIAIRSGQGFFVKATGAGNVQFTNAMRSNNTTNPFFRNATTSESPSRVWLELTHNNEVLASSLIGYTSQATIGIDSGFDSKPFGGSAALVSLIGSEGFAIQGRPTFEDTDQVDLGFEAGIAGDYSIALANKDGIFTTGQAVYLKDLTTNTTHDLTSGPYSFATPIGIFNSRFQLVYQNGTLGTTTIGDAANSYVITSNNIITIGNAYEKIESVVIYDIQGRELARKTNVNAHALEVSSITQKNQVLVVAITTTTGVATKKVLF